MTVGYGTILKVKSLSQSPRISLRSVRNEIAVIPQIMLRKVIANMQKRWEACVVIQVDGQKLSDIVYHK